MNCKCGNVWPKQQLINRIKKEEEEVMKKTISISAMLAMLLVVPVSGMCAPFLQSSCTPAVDKVTSFQLQFGTAAAIDIPAAECVPVVTDGKRINYDLGTLPNGPFSVKDKALNLWGGSEWTNPLSDTKQLPSSPSLLKITP